VESSEGTDAISRLGFLFDSSLASVLNAAIEGIMRPRYKALLIEKKSMYYEENE